jgi:hypothetical protein
MKRQFRSLIYHQHHTTSRLIDHLIDNQHSGNAALVLGANILQSADLLLTHSRHNGHNQVLPLSETILDLQVVTNEGAQDLEKVVGSQHALIKVKIYLTWVSRLSSLGSLRSSLVPPLSVSRLTCIM